MKLTEPLVRLFDWPIQDILNALPDENSPLWEADRTRQTTFQVHRQTRSITFEWLEPGWEVGGPANVKRYDYAPRELCAPVYACAEKLQAHYSGKLVRMTLAELAPRGKIATHVDNNISITAVHRCHVPVLTNENVKFIIDRVAYFLEPNIAYEFDNTRSHAVDNQSDQRRVHLLCDILPPELVV